MINYDLKMFERKIILIRTSYLFFVFLCRISYARNGTS